jgi:hypothetical protein
VLTSCTSSLERSGLEAKGHQCSLDLALKVLDFLRLNRPSRLALIQPVAHGGQILMLFLLVRQLLLPILLILPLESQVVCLEVGSKLTGEEGCA